MKKIICLILDTLIITSVYAQSALQEHQLTVTLKTVDDVGQSVADAKVWVSYDMTTNRMIGLTDTNGIFIASHFGRSVELEIHGEKQGYYSFSLQHQLGYYYKTENWNPTISVLLKRIGNPIPMYAKHAEMKLQQVAKPMGFDLEAGDWVAPYGKGFHTDLLFNLLHRQIIGRMAYDCYLTVTFPNQGDGLAVAPSEAVTGSEFKTSRKAAENGYQPELDLHYSNTNSPDSVFGYFIRVRTVLNPDGSVNSALYGKIAGNFRFYAGTIAPTSGMGFTYYLNPTPNDRNVEFNPKKNLVKDLKPDEEVSAP
jgi:hypothetical protein